MIIQVTRVAAADGARALAAHVLRGRKNEHIELVRGCEDDLGDMVADARAHGAKYAIRHYSISPEEPASREDALEIVADLAAEFGFDPRRAVVVEHRKSRAGGAGFELHWHAMVPEVDPVRRRVLDAHWMRPRHEKIARIAEIRLGHAPVQGRWSAAVARALEAEGNGAAAAAAELARKERPRSAYTSEARRSAERRGYPSVPAARRAVADAWTRGDSDAARLAAIQDAGFELAQGRKSGVILVLGPTPGGEQVEIGALDRLTREARLAAGEDAAEWRKRLAEAWRLWLAPAPPEQPQRRQDIAQGGHYADEAAPALGGHRDRGHPARRQAGRAGQGSRPEGAHRLHVRGAEGSRQDAEDRGQAGRASVAPGRGRGPDRPAPRPAVGAGRGAAPYGSETRHPPARADRKCVESATLEAGLRRAVPDGTLHVLTVRLRLGPNSAEVEDSAREMRRRRADVALRE